MLLPAGHSCQSPAPALLWFLGGFNTGSLAHCASCSSDFFPIPAHHSDAAAPTCLPLPRLPVMPCACLVWHTLRRGILFLFPQPAFTYMPYARAFALLQHFCQTLSPCHAFCIYNSDHDFRLPLPRCAHHLLPAMLARCFLRDRISGEVAAAADASTRCAPARCYIVLFIRSASYHCLFRPTHLATFVTYLYCSL